MGTGPAAIFCGNLSKNKELDFLFTAAKIIHAERPDFSLLIVGNGPLREHVEVIAARERFIHYFGPRIGREKALLLKMAKLFLLPGAVGLAVLDSFTAGLPLVTTDTPSHGPEFSYLKPGVNGVVTPHSAQAYARTVLGLLADPKTLTRLQAGARESAAQYSIEKMTGNFHRGILECLATVPARRMALQNPVVQTKDLNREGS
jgi:glycosyltransferase involved in cell wall biosynthesis